MQHPSLPILDRSYQLNLWLTRHAVQFDRCLRFQLGERLQSAGTQLCLALVRSRHAKRLDRPLAKADEHLDELRLLLHMAMDLRALSQRQYGYAATEIAEIGRQLGGWRRSIQSRS